MPRSSVKSSNDNSSSGFELKMKVFRHSGKLSDLAATRMEANSSSDEFQELIVVPTRSRKDVKCLRYIFFSLLALASISLIYYFTINHTNSRTQKFGPNINLLVTSNAKGEACEINEDWRIDCLPSGGSGVVATKEECSKRGCCWWPQVEKQRAPYCFFSRGFNYYEFGNWTSNSGMDKGRGRLIKKSPYPKDLKNLDIEISHETENILRIRITDPKEKRYEVPLNYKTYMKKPDENSKIYMIEKFENGFKVFRAGEKSPLFDTTIAPLIYSDQFIQITSWLPSEFIYGIGETVDSLKRSMEWSTSLLYTHDLIPTENKNLYGAHPFFLSMEKGGKSFGVFLANSNAMEVILQPGPAVTFRTIGGIIDLRIFLGPQPKDVINQYTESIGFPFIPPYWSLGFHLCRFGYESLNETKEILEKNLRAEIPIETQWNDLDYMLNRNDFTIDPVNYQGLSDFVKDLHKDGRHWIPIVDPGISAAEKEGSYPPYDDGMKMDIFIKDSYGIKPFVGKVWNPKATVWPDWTHPNSTKYWLEQLQRFHDLVQFDGLWIDMNEPVNFWDGHKGKDGCPANNNYDNPPYVPGIDQGKLYRKAICPSAKHFDNQLHYNLHNLYGTLETIATNKALGDIRQERPFIISRSSFPGQGHFGGKWSGDVVSSYDDLRKSVPQMLNFGLFGIPMTGADICGFNGNATKELCRKWSMLGAFYPFSRNHNEDDAIPQDPVSMGFEVVESAKETLNLRYSLLPYIYSLFFRAHLSGYPVARMLAYEFPEDVFTYDIERQFMLGDAIMVNPLLDEKDGENGTLDIYLPMGWWYSHYYPNDIISSIGSELQTVKVPKYSIPILYKGGSVITKQVPGKTTTECRNNKFIIQAFLSRENNNASGEFFWDDGITNSPNTLNTYNYYTYKSDISSFIMTREKSGYQEAKMILGQIEIWGLRQREVKSVVINNVAFDLKFEHHILTVSNMSISIVEGFSMKWN